MVLGYRSYRQIVYIYTGVLVMAMIAFWVRSVRFESFSPSLNFRITLLSIGVVVAFWEALRFIDRLLDRKLPFEDGIGQRVGIQLILGAFTGIIIRFCVYFF